MKNIYKTIVSLTCLSCAWSAHGAEFNFGYDTKYVSEGRNNLTDGGIIWANLSSDIDEQISWTVAYGIATASTVDYDELNVTISYANSHGTIDYYVDYTYLAFFEDDADDNEIGLGAAWQGLGAFTPFVDVVYSTESAGSFVQVGIQSQVQTTQALSITPYLMLAYDFGYASDAHDGYNHTAIGVTSNYVINSEFSVSLFLEQTFGGTDVRVERGQSDQFWAGMRLHYGF
ncbi:hypothetical protein [Aliiglaciecola litoralis]|uniref:TIGR02001 family outer membrane protein n=1 Tax=Aliiglaciecola litoralis TaxID=582857 RepID=A0ABN1LE28_9ALTE